MFNPPLRGWIKIAGMPVLFIPDSDKKYSGFLAWWFETGRLKPTDPQGWSSLSGPGVMWNRVEAIDPGEWANLLVKRSEP